MLICKILAINNFRIKKVFAILFMALWASAFGQAMDERPPGMSQQEWREHLNFKNYRDPAWAREEIVNLEVPGEIAESDGFLNFPKIKPDNYFLSRNYVNKYLPIANTYHCEDFDYYVILSFRSNVRECTEILYVLVDLNVEKVLEVIGKTLGVLKIKLKSHDEIYLYSNRPEGWSNRNDAGDFFISQITKMNRMLNIERCPVYSTVRDVEKLAELKRIAPLGGRTDGAPPIDQVRLDGHYDFDEVWVIDASPYFGGGASIISLQRRQYTKKWVQQSNGWIKTPSILNWAYMQHAKSYVPTSLLTEVVGSIKPFIGPRGIRITDSFVSWTDEEDLFQNRCYKAVRKKTP